MNTLHKISSSACGPRNKCKVLKISDNEVKSVHRGGCCCVIWFKPDFYGEQFEIPVNLRKNCIHEKKQASAEIRGENLLQAGGAGEGSTAVVVVVVEED